MLLLRHTFCQRHHAVERGMNFELFRVAERAVPGDLLAVALQFQNAHRGGIRLVVKGAGFLQAGHVLPRGFRLDLVLQPVDFAEQRAFAQLQFSLGQIRFGGLQIGGALGGVRAILRLALLHLVRQVVELGLGIARIVQFLGAVEFRKHVAGLDHYSVGDDLGQGDLAALSPDLRHLHGKDVYRLDGPRQAHFMARRGLDGRLGIGARRMHDRRGRRAAAARRGKGEQRTPQHRLAGPLHRAFFRKLVRRRNGTKCL